MKMEMPKAGYNNDVDKIEKKTIALGGFSFSVQPKSIIIC